MTCEACGGDGLIECGAYRGDEGSDTRTCALCNGVVGCAESPSPLAADAAGKPFAEINVSGSPATSYEERRRERLANPIFIPNGPQMSGEEIEQWLVYNGYSR
jgi:hypothetical protein